MYQWLWSNCHDQDRSGLARGLKVRYLISTGQSLHYEQNHVVYKVTTRPTSMILGKSRTYNHDQGIQDSTKAG